MAYEEDVARHGSFVKSWLRYLKFKENAESDVRFVIFERAVLQLPRSYKLWHMYLEERVHDCKRFSPIDSVIDFTIGCFERALSTLHTMPVIWEMYCSFLARHHRVSEARRAFDRSLRCLPLTQHDRVWQPYVQYAQSCNVVETAVRVYRRYVMYAPEAREELVEFLLESNHVDEAVKELVVLLEDEDTFRSSSGRTRMQMWQQLCELIAMYPEEVVSLKGRVENIVRAGIERFPDEDTGKLWTGLANHFIGLGLFDKARDIFEEGMQSVMKVRDFALIWDAYSEFEEGVLQAMIEETGGGRSFDLQAARFDSILQRRPFLLSSVLLRKQPNDVTEWHNRAKLFKEKEDWVNTALTYKEAIEKVDPKAARGKVSSLHVSYAQFYEQHGELDRARRILQKAREVSFGSVDELASIYCAQAEMEIRNHNSKAALDMMRDACVVPSAHMRDVRGLSVSDRLYRSTKMWCLLADLEESIGTPEGVRAAYEAMLDLKIATPKVVLNYAAYLEEHKYFEDSFRVYERGVDMFDFPHSFDLWLSYLLKFVQRFKGSKVERARDIFEQGIEKVPAEFAKTLYIMYADFEERFGLARNAMAIYERATRAVLPEEQYTMYLLYIARATEFFGVSRTREIFERAIATLPDKFMQDVCLRFAELEKKLGEVDRARAIYRYCANFCDPRNAIGFWQTWHNFEVSFGNEETFREMLRIKKSVTAKFDLKVNVLTPEAIAAIQDKIKQEMGGGGGAKKTNQAPSQPVGAAAAAQGTLAPPPGVPQIVFSAPPSNSREVVLDDDDEEEGQEEENSKTQKKRAKEDDDNQDDVRVVQLKVPQAVYGSIAPVKEETKKRKI